MVVPKDFRGRALANPQRPRGQHADIAPRHAVKVPGALNELFARAPHVSRHAVADRTLDRARNSRQSLIRWQWKVLQAVALKE